MGAAFKLKRGGTIPRGAGTGIGTVTYAGTGTGTGTGIKTQSGTGTGIGTGIKIRRGTDTGTGTDKNPLSVQVPLLVPIKKLVLVTVTGPLKLVLIPTLANERHFF